MSKKGTNNPNWKGADISKIEDGVIYVNLYGTSKQALVDESDYNLICNHAWRILNNHSNRGCVGNLYVITGPSRLMHRIILGASNGQITDHINGNGLDNRRSNLRFVTASQNNLNYHKKHKRPLLSLPTGVGVVKWLRNGKYVGNGKFHAQIKVNGKSRFLGVFNDAIKAGKAYNKARKQLLQNI